MISSSFLVLHINRSIVMLPVHRPLLSLGPDISHSENIHSLRCSPVKLKQYNLAKRWISNAPTEGGDHSLSHTTAKEISNYLVTQRQIGDSQPFSPLELIAMYPEHKSVPAKRQQSGDKAEKEKKYSC
jgi:hypothetical protein